MTFIKITNIKNETGLINSDHLQTVDTIDGKVRLYFIGNVTITISLDEYVRIEPQLLPDTPASAEPANPSRVHDNGSYSQGFQDGIDHAKTKGAPYRDPNPMNELTFAALLDEWHLAKMSFAYTDTQSAIRAEKAYAELRDYVFNLAPSPFPTALISAYREYQRMLSLTGISQHRIDIQRAILIDLLGANMPLEETDHD